MPGWLGINNVDLSLNLMHNTGVLGHQFLPAFRAFKLHNSGLYVGHGSTMDKASMEKWFPNVSVFTTMVWVPPTPSPNPPLPMSHSNRNFNRQNIEINTPFAIQFWQSGGSVNRHDAVSESFSSPWWGHR